MILQVGKTQQKVLQIVESKLEGFQVFALYFRSRWKRGNWRLREIPSGNDDDYFRTVTYLLKVVGKRWFTIAETNNSSMILADPDLYCSTVLLALCQGVSWPQKIDTGDSWEMFEALKNDRFGALRAVSSLYYVLSSDFHKGHHSSWVMTWRPRSP